MIDIGPREMTMALGAIVALAIMLQIIRRVRNSRYEKIQMPNKKNDSTLNEASEENEWSDQNHSEFPSGGARIVARDELNKDNFNGLNSNIELNLETKEQKINEEILQQNNESNSKYSSNSILVLHVETRGDRVFHGDDLLSAFLSNGLRYGAKKIFHYHENTSDSGKIIFSIANSMKPGIFDLNHMSDLSTTSISLFLLIEDHKTPMHALDIMLDSAKKIAIQINGDLKDDSRSAFTKQTEDHYRQRIIDYTRIQIPGT